MDIAKYSQVRDAVRMRELVLFLLIPLIQLNLYFMSYIRTCLGGQNNNMLGWCRTYNQRVGIQRSSGTIA